jgi:hypothetical protein
VTVCTKNREIFFGDIVDGEMYLSEAGKIVSEEWVKTAIIRSNIMLDEWVIMPNHLHGILVIVERAINVETPRRGVSTISYWKPVHNNGAALIGQPRSFYVLLNCPAFSYFSSLICSINL